MQPAHLLEIVHATSCSNPVETYRNPKEHTEIQGVGKVWNSWNGTKKSILMSSDDNADGMEEVTVSIPWERAHKDQKREGRKNHLLKIN